jgi:MFS family permease
MRGSRSAIIICLLLSFASGASVNSLATSLLAIKQGFTTDNEALGRVQLLFFIGGGLIVLVGGWLTDFLGEKRAALTALASLAVGAMMVGGAPSLKWVFVSAALLGLGSTWTCVSYSVIVARYYPTKRQSMFSMISLSETTAAILQPIAFSAWFARVERGVAHSWLAVFYGLAVVPILGFMIISLIWRTTSLAPPQTIAMESLAKTPKKVSGRHVIFSGAMWLIGVCVLLHGIYQIGYVSWIGPYDASRIGISPAKAAIFISMNNIGFFPGRALLGWLCLRVAIPDLALLGMASGMATLMILLGLVTRNYELALTFCFLEGFFAAGDFPAMSSFVGGHFLEQAGSAYAVFTGFGQIGSAAGGYIVGLLARFWDNIQQAVWVIPVASLLLSLLALAWHVIGRRYSREL